MTNNAPIDELLLDLSRWGSVALGWKFGQWYCEVTVPGYSTRYHMHPNIAGVGVTPSEAVDVCFAALDEWQGSGQMAEDRAKAERDHAFYTKRYNDATVYQRHGFDAIRKPPPLEPQRPFNKAK